MKPRATEDTPPYVAECIASGQINAPRLLASGAVFAVLLAVMSFIEAPIPRQNVTARINDDPQYTASIVRSAASAATPLATDRCARLPWAPAGHS
jgi:hypothetical protein